MNQLQQKKRLLMVLNGMLQKSSIVLGNGQYMDIEEIPDDTFAQKMLGDGYAINPVDGIITAPVDGTITSVFPTKHAIGFKTNARLVKFFIWESTL